MGCLKCPILSTTLLFHTWRSLLPRCDGDASYKTALLGASKLFDQVQEQQANSCVQVRGNLVDETEAGKEVFQEVAVLTDQELMDVMKRTQGTELDRTKETGSIPVSMRDQLGQPVSLHVVSLKGIPCSEIHSLRRLRIFSRQGLVLQDLLAEASRLLQDDELQKQHQHHAATRLANQPTGLKDTSTRHIPTLQTLEDKYNKNTAKRKSLVAEAKAALEEDEEEDDEDSQAPSEEDGVVVMSMPSKTTDIPSKGKGKRRRGNSPTKGSTKEEKKGKDGRESIEISDAGDIDPDLLEVAKRLGNVPACFAALNPQEILEKKPKIGRSLDAVPWQGCPHHCFSW